MITIISGLGVICGFFAGLVVARFGYRRMLLWALWGGATLSFIQAVLPPMPVMLGLRIVEGASHLIIVVAAPTLMAQLSPDAHRAKVMAVWSTFFGVGFALCAWFGLPFVDRFGLSGLLMFHGGVMIAVAMGLSLLLRDLPPVSRKAEPLSLSRILRAHRVAYSSPRMSPPALGWLCYTLSYVSILTVLPTQLAADDRVFASAWMPISGLLVSLTFGLALLRYLEAVRLVVLGFGLAVIIAIVLSLHPQNAWLAVGLMASLGLVQSGSFAAVPQLNTSAEDQAQANGAMAQMAICSARRFF